MIPQDKSHRISWTEICNQSGLQNRTPENIKDKMKNLLKKQIRIRTEERVRYLFCFYILTN